MYFNATLESKCAYSKRLVIQLFRVACMAFRLACHFRCLLCYSRYPDFKTYFEYELKSVDRTTNTASFRLSSKDFFSPKPESVEVKYDLLVGADGINSAVRSEMIRLDSSGPSSLKKYEKTQVTPEIYFLEIIWRLACSWALKWTFEFSETPSLWLWSTSRAGMHSSLFM